MLFSPWFRRIGSCTGRSDASLDALDMAIPAIVLPYATWTAYVNLVTATQSSFNQLLLWLPLMLLAATVITAGWIGSCRSSRSTPPRISAGATDSLHFVQYTMHPCLRWVALVTSASWTGLLFAGLPYTVFWLGSVVALISIWVVGLRCGDMRNTAQPIRLSDGCILLLLILAAASVTLIANRPDIDDAFYMSVPATLLRFPKQPVLLHDTLYRMANIPIEMPVYRLSSYEVLVGTLARVTGISHMTIAYLILPPAFAGLSVITWAALLRRLVPTRWPTVLVVLFLCVSMLGEAHQAYGNFAFVRIFQGKAILATCIIPVVFWAALRFSDDARSRNWVLLFAAQVAALGFSSTALFVVPVAASFALFGVWTPSITATRKAIVGVSASAYLVVAAGAMLWITHGGKGFASSSEMQSVLPLLIHTWGDWSTAVLFVTLLTAWAFADDIPLARFAATTALLFFLLVLNPYTEKLVAQNFVGTSTYWRLTWVLPLPFFSAIILDRIIRDSCSIKPIASRAAVITMLLASIITFAWHSGTLRRANSVTLGRPSLKVFDVEYPVATQVVEDFSEHDRVLAPELVASWLPTFVVHPGLIGVRPVFFLDSSFTDDEVKRRTALMQYVGGVSRSEDSRLMFKAALGHYGLTGIVVRHAAPWRAEIDATLRSCGWRRIAGGSYDIWKK